MVGLFWHRPCGTAGAALVQAAVCLGLGAGLAEVALLDLAVAGACRCARTVSWGLALPLLGDHTSKAPGDQVKILLVIID